MATLTTSQAPKFWQGTNFWVAALIFIFSFFGNGQELAGQIVGLVTAGIAAVFGIRQFFQQNKFGGFYKTLVQGNTLNYLAQVLIYAGIPNVDQLVPPLKTAVEAFASGNWGQIVSALVSLGTIVFYLFFRK